MINRYPILANLPEELRAECAAKADKGLPLTADECVALGFAPCDSLVLIPVCGPTPDLSVVFGGDVGALREILSTQRRKEAKGAKRESA